MRLPETLHLPAGATTLPFQVMPNWLEIKQIPILTDRFSTPEGECLFSYPQMMTEHTLAEVLEWLELMQRKLKRMVMVSGVVQQLLAQ